MQETRNYFAIMGITRAAGTEEVKLAYRRLALLFHPDRNPGDRAAESRFKLVNEAYQILSNPALRAEYEKERWGRLNARKGEEGAPARQAQARQDGPEELRSQVGEIFYGLDENYGTKGFGPAPIKGADLRYHLTVDFVSSVFGVRREIAFQAQALCSICHGSGARKDSRLTPCAVCAGTGLAARSGRPCDNCLGHGVLALDECRVCSGLGTFRSRRKLSIKVPPGCETGARLRVQGEGEPGLNGGPPGDLFVVVTVSEHPLFFRQGQDIVCELPVTIGQAVLGAEIEAPTVDGPVKVNVKPGTQHGEVILVKGRGIARTPEGKERGDQKFIVSIEIPRKLTSRQKELLAEFDSFPEADSLVSRFRKKVEELLR